MVLHMTANKKMRVAVPCVWNTYEEHVKKRYNLYLAKEVYDRAEKRAGKGKVSAYIEELIAKDWAGSITGELTPDEIASLPPDVVKELMRLQAQRSAAASQARVSKGKKSQK